MALSLTQIEFSLAPSLAEAFIESFSEEVLSVSWTENQSLWDIQLIVPSDQAPNVSERLNAFFEEDHSAPPPLSTRLLPETDWVKAVYRDFPPLTIGRFYVYGTHSSSGPEKDLLPLHINAATAFGSGHHESTEGCLLAFSQLADTQAFHAPLDMGCGSGILALAMAQLWQCSVMACDNDPEAIAVTRHNGDLNQLSHLIMPCLSEGFEGITGRQFDLIVANILAGPLCEMAPLALKALLPKGTLILSGILTRQAETVKQIYRQQGATFEDQIYRGDWSTLVLSKGE